MTGPHVEYVGFVAGGLAREYTLRVRQADGRAQSFTLCIANEAFLAHRVRYQDAAEICQLRLQRELTAAGDGWPASRLDVSETDLEEYRTSHVPRPARRRARPPETP